MSKLIIKMIKIYQISLSKIFPNTCRFLPTCSEYTIQAIQGQGLTKGLIMGIKRIGKCHPFHPGGYDPLI